MSVTTTVKPKTEVLLSEPISTASGDGSRDGVDSDMPSRAQRAIRRGMQRLTIDTNNSGVAPPAIPQTPRSPRTSASAMARQLEATRTKAAERFPITEASVTLLLYFGGNIMKIVHFFRFGTTATYMAGRLVVFALLLLPVFLQMVVVYFRDPRIKRRIRFGPNARNYADVYVPPEAQAALEGRGSPVPVVIAVMGGAWCIGHRAWNVQLGLRLTEAGIITVAIDYRNFPVGGVPEMTEDLSRGIQWVFQHVKSYGGDTGNIALMGQSAGAHLSALVLLEHALMESQRAASRVLRSDTITSDGWSVQNLKGCFLVSGPYDLVDLESHLDSRGLYSRILHHFCVNGDIVGCSPTRLLQTPEWLRYQAQAVALLPPVSLFHGKLDKTVPFWSTIKFAESLRAAGVNVRMDIRDGLAHAEIIVEGPMRGDEYQVEPLLVILFGDEASKRSRALTPLKPMYPRRIINIASSVMPF